MTRKTSRGLFTLKHLAYGAVLASLSISSSFAAQPKHVAVAPENMAQQKLASPQSKGLLSHSTMLPIYSNQSVNKTLSGQSVMEINQTIYFDGNENSPLVFIGPNVEKWQLTVTNPNGKQVINEMNGASSKLAVKPISMGQQSFKGKQLILSNPQMGMWQVKLTQFNNKKNIQKSLPTGFNKTDFNKGDFSSNKRSITTNIKPTALTAQPDGFLMFKGDPSYKLYSYLDNNQTIQNENINIVAYLVDNTDKNNNRKAMTAKKPMPSNITRAYATVTSPSNKRIKVMLNDNGRNGDKIAGDGLFSGKIPTNEVGVYTSQVQVQGVRPDGIRFSRTATDIYPIEKPSFRFTNRAAELKILKGNQGSVSVPVIKMKGEDSVYLSAEVWGTNNKGRAQAAAWIGGVTEANKGKLTLNFDTRWLARNQLKAPFSLRSVRMQSIQNNVPIAEMKRLPMIYKTASRNFRNRENFFNKFNLSSQKSSPAKLNLAKVGKAITNEMLMGKAPVSTAISTKASGGPKLLLVHGYCSGKVWSTSNFTNAAEFVDYDQSRSHEDFAQRIMSFGSPYSSYGIIAHSQGGAAALHIYTRYWSGLDYSTGGRMIQTVGTPYRGTALAGNLAVLGEVFGAGCGKNTDLTYSGAANWLSTIPSWARSQVDYYTTSFETKWWRYDYCHIATDLFLDDPEDGTTEKWSGQLSGGVNKGHKTGWCHTQGMRDTAQYYDWGRNASMNSRAAR